MRKYKRFHKFMPVDVLKHIGKPNFNFWVPSQQKHMLVGKISTQRMLLIAKTQTCVACQLKGTYFWLEKQPKNYIHFNLYANGYYNKETMMTMDHIIPKSKGGLTIQENLQLMCEECNKTKSDMLISVEEVLMLRFIKNPNLFEHVKNSYQKTDPSYIPTLISIFENRNSVLECVKS